MNKLLKYIVWFVFIAPAAYLGFIWNNLPERVPMHYNLKGEVDHYGDKNELLLMIGILTIINIGTYFLISNINKIDPKKKFSEENRPRLQRLAFAISVFLSAIAIYILYSSLHGGIKFNAKLLVIGIGLLFTIIGNYFYTIKPNYFAGLRTPWALENEENWRLTHKLGGKLWFAGGLFIAAAGFLLKDLALIIVLFTIILFIVIVPIVYSYRLYVKKGNDQPEKNLN